MSVGSCLWAKEIALFSNIVSRTCSYRLKVWFLLSWWVTIKNFKQQFKEYLYTICVEVKSLFSGTVNAFANK